MFDRFSVLFEMYEMKEVFMKKNIYQLLAARTFSEFANSMYMIVLPLIILDMKGSLTDVSFFFTVSKIPAVLLLPLLGVFAEKVSRKKLIVVCNFFAVVLFGCQFILYYQQAMHLLLLTLLGTLLNIAFSATDIGTRMIFTEIVPAGQLEKYNGTKSLMDNAAAFIAPMLGTFLYGLFGAELVILIVLGFYTVAALGTGKLRYTRKQTLQTKQTHVFKEIRKGMQFVKTQRKILAFFVLATALNFFAGATEEIINPGIIITKYGISKQFFGFSSAFNIAGVIMGSLFIVRNKKISLHKNMPKFFILNSLVMIMIGIASLLLYQRSQLGFYLIFLVLYMAVGFITILVNVPLNAYFQAKVPLEYQGRFFSLLVFAANLSIPFGISFTGMLAERIGPDTMFIVNNLCIIVIVIFTYRSAGVFDEEEGV